MWLVCYLYLICTCHIFTLIKWSSAAFICWPEVTTALPNKHCSRNCKASGHTGRGNQRTCEKYISSCEQQVSGSARERWSQVACGSVLLEVLISRCWYIVCLQLITFCLTHAGVYGMFCSWLHGVIQGILCIHACWTSISSTFYHLTVQRLQQHHLHQVHLLGHMPRSASRTSSHKTGMINAFHPCCLVAPYLINL